MMAMMVMMIRMPVDVFFQSKPSCDCDSLSKTALVRIEFMYV